MNRQKWIIAICLVVLAGLVLTWILLPRPEPEMSKPSVSTTCPSNPTGTGNCPTTATDPTGNQTTLPPPPPAGQVRLYTCDPRLHPIYEELAARYSQQTGISVTVLPLREGSCRENLEAYLLSDTPPTVFCLHDEATLTALSPRLVDFTATGLLEMLHDPGFALQQDGRPVALAVDVQAYGLIYNTALLGKASFSRVYFTDEAHLENAVHHVWNNRSDSGFYPFGTLQFTEAETGLLLQMYTDPARLRQFLDLYRANDRTGGSTLDQFLAGKTTFYIGSTGDYQQFSTLSDGAYNLDILPVLYPDGAKMHYVCSHYWALDGQASREDRAATVHFLRWMVTAGEEDTPVDRLGLLSPFRDARYQENVLQRKLRTYMARDAVQLSLPCQRTDLSALRQALTTYFATPNDKNWAAVEALL